VINKIFERRISLGVNDKKGAEILKPITNKMYIENRRFNPALKK